MALRPNVSINHAVLQARIAGLREAAQILSGYLKAGNTAGLQTGLLLDSLDDILARIAELEKP